MPTLTIEGHQVPVDDSFLRLSPDQQNAAVEQIASRLGLAPKIGNEISSGITGALQSAGKSIADYLNPFSEARHASYARQASEPLGQALKDNLSQIAGTGAALASPVTTAGNVVDEAVTPFIAHPFQKLNQAVGVNIPYQQAKSQASLALMGLAPRGASPIGVEPAALAPLKPSQLPSPDVLRADATSVYNRPSIRAIKTTPKSLAGIATDTAADFKRSGFNEADQPGVFRVLNEIKTAGSGRSPTGQVLPYPNVDQLDTWSRRLGKIAKETQIGMSGPEPTPNAAAAMQLKSKVDDLLTSLSPELQTADANYSASKIARGLNRQNLNAEIRAEGGNGDYAAKLRATATRLLLNPKLTRGMTPKELETLKSISKGTATQNALTSVADLLGSKISHGVGTILGGGAGFAASGGSPMMGAAGAVAGTVADAAAKSAMMGIRNNLAARQAQKLINSVLARSPKAKALAMRNYAQVPIPPKSIAAILLSREPSALPLTYGMVPTYAQQNQPR